MKITAKKQGRGAVFSIPSKKAADGNKLMGQITAEGFGSDPHNPPSTTIDPLKPKTTIEADWERGKPHASIDDALKAVGDVLK